KGENIPEPGVPESFKVLIKELQALCLDVRVLNDNNQEVQLRELTEENDSADLEVNIEGTEEFVQEQPAVESDDNYTSEIEVEEEDYDGFQLEEFQDNLELDDFNDEH
ncbi:MAG: hypothetical protein E6789_09980, partial [Clostridium baratii]|nr:hypothetical protein [Clostridium baratii]